MSRTRWLSCGKTYGHIIKNGSMGDAEVASPAHYPAVSFGSFLWLYYLPNSVAANGNCNAVMLGVNVAPIV